MGSQVVSDARTDLGEDIRHWPRITKVVPGVSELRQSGARPNEEE
jgi:hypothetical protein